MFRASSLSSPTALAVSSTGQGGTLPRTAAPSPTVLLVDDDADSLFLLSQILEQFKCSSICETDGLTALNLIKELQPDLVLLDIWLPRINGLEIIRELRRIPATQSIPVIAVTALASPSDRETILQAGCNHYISKPYGLEDMEGLLGKYLQGIE